jgi:hypothetical protein
MFYICTIKHFFMLDRIEINGVWYVRENPEETIIIDTTDYYGCVYENESFCFDATKLESDDTIDIEITDKRKTPWETHHYDSQPFLIGILDGDIEVKSTNVDILGLRGHNYLKKFLETLRIKKWI